MKTGSMTGLVEGRGVFLYHLKVDMGDNGMSLFVFCNVSFSSAC